MDIVCSRNKRSILVYPRHNNLESKKEKMSHEKLSMQEMRNIAQQQIVTQHNRMPSWWFPSVGRFGGVWEHPVSMQEMRNINQQQIVPQYNRMPNW